jgi:phosphatidylserine decarboxylase
MLIDIPGDIHEFHEAVDGMFEEVSLFLGQFVCIRHQCSNQKTNAYVGLFVENLLENRILLRR